MFCKPKQKALTAALQMERSVGSRHSCRLLQQGPQEAKRVINPPLPPIHAFAEEQSAELRDRIFDEFNSLAVVYQQPSSSFVQQADASAIEDGQATV